MRLVVVEFIPITDDLLSSGQSISTWQLEAGRSQQDIRSTKVVGTYLPDLKRICLDHIADLVSYSGYAVEILAAEMTGLQQKVFQAVSKFYRKKSSMRKCFFFKQYFADKV